MISYLRLGKRGLNIYWFHGGAVVLDAVAGMKLSHDLPESRVG